MALKYRALDTATGQEKFVSGTGGTWNQEVPSGTINGVNTDFVVVNTPQYSDAVFVYLDGAIVPKSRYSVNLGTKTVSFTTAPSNAQDVYIVYLS